MGRTLLGVMPAPIKNDRQPVLDPSITEISGGGFTPLEQPPATLTGLHPHLPPAEVPPHIDPTHATPTAIGLSASRAGTSSGFGSTVKVEPPRDPQAPKTTKTLELEVTARGSFDDKTPVIHSAAPDKSGFKGTLLGVSPISPLMNTLPAGPAGGAEQPHSFQNKTMLGVAPIGVIPRTFEGSSEAPDMERKGSFEPPILESGLPHHKGTLLGVAMPGIAPLNPGVQKAEALPRDRSERAAAMQVDAPTSLDARIDAAVNEATNKTVERIDEQRTLQHKRLAIVLGILATVLLGVIATALFWWKSLHLTVTVITSETNTEQLRIDCSACQEGTTIKIDGRSAVFHQGQATLQLQKKLAIGLNRLALEVKRPNRTRSEIVSAIVPVEFRVTSDLSELVKDPPQLLVAVEAVPQTHIQIDDRTFTVGADGKLKIPFDVTAQLTGPSSGVGQFERKLDYRVTQRDGTIVSGSIVVKTPITPLELVSPGLAFITPKATFTLSGRTSPKAKLTANNHPLAVSSDGAYLQDMALSAPGATRLRVIAHEEGLAPRFVEIALERVVNDRQRAEEMSRNVEKTYDSVVQALASKPGSLVALSGEIVAEESVGPTTRYVIQSNCAHPPCLTSIRYGAPLALKRGQRIRAIGIGRLTKRADSAERDLAIEASLVVED
jgi:hypothetical protein